MMKPAAGYRPLAYSSPNAVQTTGTVAVKAAAAMMGLNPSEYTGHSLRSGFCTSAAANGADVAAIMRHSRHKSVAGVIGYIHAGIAVSNEASKAIKL